jgi:hypothetical protein
MVSMDSKSVIYNKKHGNSVLFVNAALFMSDSLPFGSEIRKGGKIVTARW